MISRFDSLSWTGSARGDEASPGGIPARQAEALPDGILPDNCPVLAERREQATDFWGIEDGAVGSAGVADGICGFGQLSQRGLLSCDVAEYGGEGVRDKGARGHGAWVDEVFCFLRVQKKKFLVARKMVEMLLLFSVDFLCDI